jgi:hypothetical protein
MGLRALGAVLAAVGVGLWSSALAYFQPEAASRYHEMTPLALLAKDLRWSALLLGIGGLSC